MSLDPFTILLAFNIVMLAGVILLLPLCLLEARYMDEPGEPRRPTFPPAVRLGDRDLRDLYSTHTDLAQKPDGKGRPSGIVVLHPSRPPYPQFFAESEALREALISLRQTRHPRTRAPLPDRSGIRLPARPGHQ